MANGVVHFPSKDAVQRRQRPFTFYKVRGLNREAVNRTEATAPSRPSRCCFGVQARYATIYNEYICSKCFRANGRP